EALRRALAMGGDDGVLVTDEALVGADEWATAKVLAAALDKLAPDVALMGMASDDARGSLVPGAVAAMRDVPLLSYGAELKVGDGEARVRRLSPTGYDWIGAPLPVVATVTDQVGEPRYASLKGIMAAKRKPLETLSLGDIGLSGDDLHGDPRLAEGLGERCAAIAQDARAHLRVIGADVRRGGDHADAPGRGGPCQLERAVDVADAVVDAGQDVAVDVDEAVRHLVVVSGHHLRGSPQARASNRSAPKPPPRHGPPAT
ncbi:MAG: hypothetical protein KY433_09795, partial [Actinobacteria bacterium]|nr:hypothetical protein [Actinomycetota bacterium]